MEAERFLRYSQHIVLCGTEEEQIRHTSTSIQTKVYYLSAHGHYNPEVFVLGQDSHLEIPTHFFSGFSDMVFQILPMFQFEVQTFL